VQYAEYSGIDQLEERYNSALDQQQNVVLKADRLNDPTMDFARSVAEGLDSNPRLFECRFLYDAKGSALYEKICAQPEYYQTRTEGSILKKYAQDISNLTGLCTLIELGSGSSVKTSYLLSAYQNQYKNICYSPIDISSSALKDAGRTILAKHPRVQVVGINSTYYDSFTLIRCASPALVIFLGSTIGNFTIEEEKTFWTDVSENMQTGDYFLLGVDLIKDSEMLDAAYNDKAGITEQFTLNYFARMNRELDAGLDLDTIAHVAHYNSDKEQVEIFAEFRKATSLQVGPLNRSFGIGQGERILLEISRKFKLDRVREKLISHGLNPIRAYTDENNWFGLVLVEKGDLN
jgi:L-histidine N-alpha-methyltransferase